MDNIPTSSKLSKTDELNNWINTREPILKGMYFYDDPKINVSKDLKYGIQEFASKVWMESYSIFEADIRTILDYLARICADNEINLVENKNYDLHLDSLMDLKALSDHQMLKLKDMELREIEELSHDYRLRMTFGEMETYVKNRNLVYLIFITLLQYTSNINDEYRYLLLVLNYLILLYKSDDLASMDENYQVLDLSIYEISRILNLNNRRRFERLVTYGSQINSQPEIDKVIIKLISILLSENKEDRGFTLIDFVDDLTLKLFTPLPKKQPIKHIQEHSNTKINMESIDWKKTPPNLFDNTSSNNEELQDLVNIKPQRDRYKSEYSVSQLTKHQIKILLSKNNICLLEWLRNNCNDYLYKYHIHENQNSGDLIMCHVNLQIHISELFRISPVVEVNQISLELSSQELFNTNSNLLFQSGPGFINENLSPKIGISLVRIHPAIVVDNKTNIFTKSKRLNLNNYQSSDKIFNILRTSNHPLNNKMTLDENIAVLERLIKNDNIKKYQIENFQEKMVLFLVLDIIQQRRLLENNNEFSQIFSSLFNTQDLLTILLI